MIKRLISKKLVPVEKLTEDFNVGAGGIDVSSPPTKPDTVYDMENFDVSLDKGLTLRNPLIFDKHSISNADNLFVSFAFDESHLEILKNKRDIEYVSLEDVKDIKHADYFENTEDPTDIILAEDVYIFEDWHVIFLDGKGVDIVTDRGAVIERDQMQFSKISVINTNTSTIILGISFDLNYSDLQHYSKNYALGSSNFKPRPVRITKENNTYKAEIMQIENPTLYTESDGNVTRASFNLMNDYIYSLKDNYNAGYAYTNGILKYTPADASATVGNLNIYTVEDLTESDKFLLVDTITESEKDKIYILKAFVTSTSIDTPNYKIYCTWEKTYDNVTWTPAPEFLNTSRDDLITLEVEDSTKSYEHLDESYKYSRTIQCAPFLGTDATNLDRITDRPDVLVLSSLDAATYRFSIYSVATSPVEGTLKLIPDKTYYQLLSPESAITDGYIIINDQSQANLQFKIHAEFEGNVVSSLNHMEIGARSVFKNTSTDLNDYTHSFNNSLSDVTLNSIFQGAYNWSYPSESGNTYADFTVTIPIELNSNWISQRLCLNFYIFENSEPTDVKIYWGDETMHNSFFSTIVGKDYASIEPESNPDFKYGVLDMVTESTDNSITIIGGNPSRPDCFKYDNPYFNSQHVSWLTQYTGNKNGWYSSFDDSFFSYVDRNNTLDVKLRLSITEIKSKKRIPLELLEHLNNESSLTTLYKKYIFNKFKYYLKNITIGVTITISTTIWASFSTNGFGINAYKAYADMLIRITNMEMSLYDYLSIPNNPNVLGNIITSLVNNTNISSANHGPFSYEMDYRRGDSSMSDKTYNKIKNFFEQGPGFSCVDETSWKSKYPTPVNKDKNYNTVSIVVTSAPLIAYMLKKVVLGVADLCKSGTISSNNVSRAQLHLMIPSINTTVGMKNIHFQKVSDTDMYWYGSSWNYSTPEGEFVHINEIDGVKETTPESYKWRNSYGSYSDAYVYPFYYLYNYDGVNQKHQLIKLKNENDSILDIYKTVSDNNNSYNVSEEILKADTTAELSGTYTYVKRYCLLLASTPNNMIFTQHKFEPREIISLADSNNIYYNYRIWHYGKTLGNNIYFSNVDTTTVPIENCLTLSTDSDDFVTSLVPWRDYLIATTNTKIFLISKYNDSYVFKQINTFVGVPEKDSRTCKAILNGIIFKSGSKIFTLHPNTYSSDDTILNIVDISKPISHHLIDGIDNFAIATEYYYYVFIPRVENTLVFKYEYARKIWSKYTYPVVLYKAKLFNVRDIVVLDTHNNIYNFDKSLDWYKEKLNVTDLQYGDYLNEYTSAVKPIAFYLDTGQKSSDMQVTKQFTESKLLVSTKDNAEILASNTKIYVDGFDLKVSHTTDIGNLTETSATYENPSFSKTHPTSLPLLANTNFDNEFNVMRQIMFRYMGKGKTIRHVFKGESTFNFKIYVLYYRYRIPHNKQ